MTLSERITADMKEAMKQKNNATLSTLRLLLSAMKNKQIDLQHPLSEQEVQDVIKSQVKQLKDSVDSFAGGGREDMAESARTEIALLETYLPAQLPDEALEAIVKEAVAQSGAQGKQDAGKAMGAAMKLVAGRADGTRVKQIVERLLSVFALVAVGITVSAPVHAAIDLVPNAFDLSTEIVTLLRVVRVLILWIGVFAVNSILNGGFSYMVSNHNDHDHHHAIALLTSGFIGSVVVLIGFAITTVYINVL